MVVPAIFNKAYRVKKAWWPVMMTFGKVSSRANTSSLRITLSDLRRKSLLSLRTHRGRANRSCRAPPAHYPSDFDSVFCEIARRVAIPAGGNGYGMSEFEKRLRHRLGGGGGSSARVISRMRIR